MTRRRCEGCGLNRQEKFFVGPRGKKCEFCRATTRKKNSRSARLKKLYDITLDEYDAIKAVQGGVCGGCGGTRTYELHVDHDHKVERERGSRASVRGLLCANDNGILRKAKDNATLLRKLADYLDHPPARGVLDEGVGSV